MTVLILLLCTIAALFIHRMFVRFWIGSNNANTPNVCAKLNSARRWKKQGGPSVDNLRTARSPVQMGRAIY